MAVARGRQRPTSVRPGEWVSLREHLAAQRESDLRFEVERDRRYAEVSVEREKALKIKEVADLAALQLAREIQTYKDEKANELREQISSERGHYASKDDLAAAVGKIEATLAPLLQFAAAVPARSAGGRDVWGFVIGAGGLLLAAVAFLKS